MPNRWSPYNRMGSLGGSSLHKLLGELEVKIMLQMWRRGEATVREVATDVQQERAVAYTTVMTVMGHLVEKGLLTRRPLDKKTHLYSVALTQEEFLSRESQKMVVAMLEDFGDLALVQFLEAVEEADPQHLEHLRRSLETSRASDPESEVKDAGI
jgi:predicted transcriptional regulator